MFEQILDLIIGLKCRIPCRAGGGKKKCSVRNCAKKRGYQGCWECGFFKHCALLKPMAVAHGSTLIRNLRLIRSRGVRQWSGHRGPHYVWLNKK